MSQGGSSCPTKTSAFRVPQICQNRPPPRFRERDEQSAFQFLFVTIWIAGALLLLVCQIVAPATLSSSSWAILLPIGSIVAVVALGQMLVIMMGGIDLSMAGAISLLANILVGVAKGPTTASRTRS